MTKRHPAQDMPAPKGYMCAAGCGHGIAVHLEGGCDTRSCDCPAPFGRIMPTEPSKVPVDISPVLLRELAESLANRDWMLPLLRQQSDAASRLLADAIEGALKALDRKD